MTIHAVNAKNLAISEYSGLTLTDLAVLDGRLYAVAAGGLMEFSGTDDAGVDIDAYVQSGKIGEVDETRYTRAYVKDLYVNALELTSLIDRVDADELAEEQSVVYAIPARTGSSRHARTVRLRSDVKGVAWAWKIANVNGGGLKLRELSVQPEQIEIDV